MGCYYVAHSDVMDKPGASLSFHVTLIAHIHGPELELLAYLCRVPKSYNNKQEYPVREKDFFTDGATPRETRVSETFIC